IDYAQSGPNPTISFIVAASDSDPAANLQFSLAGNVPNGATITPLADDPTKALVTWTASQLADAAANNFEHDFQVIVTDTNTGLVDSNTISVSTLGSTIILDQ